MKSIVLIVSLVLFLFSSTPVVESPFVDLPYKSSTELGEIGPLSTQGTCYVPPWTECPDGYECVNYNFGWLYANGKKVGWTCDGGFTTDPGSHNYKIRIVMDIALLYWHTVTSKVLFTGDYEIQFSHSWYPQLDFGTPTSPRATCGGVWERVDNETLYSSPLGYGWEDITGLDSIDRGGNCYPWRDFVLSTSDHTFNIDADNGEYQVKLYMGDYNQLRDNIDVYAEGILKINDFTIDGDVSETSFDVIVSDGQLNLLFHDDGGSDPYWVINALMIKNIDPVDEITEMSTSLDFNYSDPGSHYIFEPSYVYGEDVTYMDCAIMWLNFTQTDTVNIGIPIEYKTYITDLNRDDTVDIYDAIILSNEVDNSWSLPVDPDDHTWRADINSDGTVNIYDAVIFKNQFGTNYIEPKDERNGFLNIWDPEWSTTC